MRVLLADVEGAPRRVIAASLEGLEGAQLVGQVSTRAEVAGALRRTRADVLLIDDRLLPPDGHTLAGLGPLPGKVQVIVLGVDDSPAFAARAMRMGAVAWIAKDRADEELHRLFGHQT